VPTSINVEAYGRAVRDAAMRRGLLTAAGRIAKAAYDESRPVASVVGESEQALFAATADMTADDVIPARAAFERLLDVTMARRESGAPIVGIPTGLTDLDYLLGGYKKSDLIFVAGRPGMGKSSFVTSNLAHIVGKLGKRAALFTMEMSVEQQTRRLACMEAGLTYDVGGARRTDGRGDGPVCGRRGAGGPPCRCGFWTPRPRHRRWWRPRRGGFMPSTGWMSSSWTISV